MAGIIQALRTLMAKDEQKLREIEKSILENEKALDKKQTEMAKVRDLLQCLKEADENNALKCELADKNFEIVGRGLSVDDEGQACCLLDQLISAKEKLSTAETEIKTAGLELTHREKWLKQKNYDRQTNDVAYSKDKRLYEQTEAKIKDLNRKLASISYENGSIESLQERKAILQKEIRKLNQQMYERNAYRYQLQYRDPEPNFDRSKVRGMVGKLLHVKDVRYYLALVMTAGGSLYSYVTDDDSTRKKILQNGQLTNRVTIIPINNITSDPIDESVVRFAQSLVGKENVQSALSLVEYDDYYDPVMKFVFGHTLVCRDLNIATQVTYHPNIQCRSVTLDGDVVDPQGTLSGGSAPKDSDILAELAEINIIEKEIKIRESEIHQIENQLQTLAGVSLNYNRIKDQLELHHHALNFCKERLALSGFQEQEEEIKSLQKQIEKLKTDIKSYKAKVCEIEAKMADVKGSRDRHLKTAIEAIKQAQKASEDSRNNRNKRELESVTLQLEIDGLQKEITKSMEQREAIIESIAKMKT